MEKLFQEERVVFIPIVYISIDIRNVFGFV